jgi:hypothetical protein
MGNLSIRYCQQIIPKPKRVIFNPGTENSALMQELAAAGVDAFPACTLVMLSTGQF